MSFLHMFAEIKRKKEESSEPKQEKCEKPSCSAGLEDTEFMPVDLKRGYFICETHYQAKMRGEIPFPEHCPFCKYNSDNLTKKLEEDLYRSCADIVGEERAITIFRK